MRNNRKAALFLTDNRIPVYEGDMVKVLVSNEGKTSIHLYPRSCDFKTPDITRLRGDQNIFALGKANTPYWKTTKRLALTLQPTDRIQIYRVTPEKRKPLLRLPVRGLPSRWV